MRVASVPVLVAAAAGAGMALTADVLAAGTVRRLDWVAHRTVEAHLAGAGPRAALTLLATLGRPELLAPAVLLVAARSASRSAQRLPPAQCLPPAQGPRAAHGLRGHGRRGRGGVAG